MNNMVTIEGIIVDQPRRWGEFTEFFLGCGSRCYQVIRLDKQWQIKDLLFLCKGQILRVAGIAEEEIIVAKKIEIIDCSIRNDHKERQYGNSCITGTDPGDPQI